MGIRIIYSETPTISPGLTVSGPMTFTMSTDRLIGRDTIGSGASEEIAVGGGLEFTGAGGIQRGALTGDVTCAAGGSATTIANDAVTYAKMQNVSADSRILGRASGAGAGDVTELTAAQVTTIINSTLDHGALVGLGDDDHTIYFKADGTRAITGTTTCVAVQPSDDITFTSGTRGIIGTAGSNVYIRSRAGGGATEGEVRCQSDGNIMLEPGTGNVVYCSTDIGKDIGSTGKRWRSAYLKNLVLIDGETAPGTIASHASTYIDSADNHPKMKFGDGAVLKLGPDIASQSVVVIDRANTSTSFTDATGINSEQTYYSFSIPGGTMLANGVVRLTLAGTYLNNSGAGRTITLKIKLGATTLIGDVSLSITNNAAARAWRIEIMLVNQNSASAQFATVIWTMSAVSAMGTAGTGDFAVNDTLSVTATGTSAINTASAATLAVTMQSSAATATQNMNKQLAVLECSPSA